MANIADTGALIFGEDPNGNPEPLKSEDGLLISKQSSTGLIALTNGSINLTVDATKDEVRLDTTITAAAGSILRIYSSTDVWLAWGGAITVAEDAAAVSAGVAELTADDGFLFAKGTELVKVPAGLTSQVWLGCIRDTIDGSLNIALVS